MGYDLIFKSIFNNVDQVRPREELLMQSLPLTGKRRKILGPGVQV